MLRFLAICFCFADLLSTLPVESPDENPLNQLPLDPNSLTETDPTNLDITYPTLDQANIFLPTEEGEIDNTALNIFNPPLLSSVENLSLLSGSNCAAIGPTDSNSDILLQARSPDGDEPLFSNDEVVADAASGGGGFCLKDASPQTEEEINKLRLPTTIEDLNNLLKPNLEPNPDPLNGPFSFPFGFWYCAAGAKVQLLCCEGAYKWDSSREGCYGCESFLFFSCSFFGREF